MRTQVIHPFRPASRSLIYLLFLFVGLLAGCGNSTQEFIHTGTSEELPFAPVSVAGRVSPGVPAAGLPVVISSESGEILAQTTSSEDGSFLFSGFAGPENFRVSATLDKNLVLETQVTGNPGGAYVVLNIPTTLAARLSQSSGLSPEQAKQRVATFLGISSAVELEHGLSEFDPTGFSHLVFYLRAQKNGGVSAYFETLLQQLQGSTAPQPFRPSLSDLYTALNLPEPLLVEFRKIQADPALRRAILATRLRENPYLAGLILEGTTHAQPKTVNPDIRASFIVDTLLDQALDVTWTHIADAANLNYGTTAMLERIQDQLKDVLDVLSSMTIAMDLQELMTAIDTVYDQAIVHIETYNSQLVNLDLASILANPENPYTPNNDTLQFLSTLQSLDTQQSLNIIESYLDPTRAGTNILLKSQSFILKDLYAQGMTADSGNFPYRTPDLYNQLFELFEYYSQYQQLGINLLGESAHIQSNPTNAIKTAQTNAEATIASLYRQRAVLPPSTKLPNNVVVDLQAGLMWYTTIQSPKSVSDAVSVAESFKLSDGNGGTYTDWHLPTLEEYRILRERARSVTKSLRDSEVAHDGSDSSEGNFGYSAQGLTALGFTNAKLLNSDGSVLYARYVLKGYQRYDLLGTSWASQNTEFRFNHENSDDKSTTSQRPFFLVRSIGKPVVPIASYVDPQGDGSYPKTVGVDDYNVEIPYDWSEVKAFEYEWFGRVSGVRQMTFLTPAGSTDQLPDRVGANLTYQFATGGEFAIGGEEYRLSFPRRLHDSAAAGVSFPTYNGPANAYTEINTRNQLVSFRSNNDKVDLGPSGRVRWRADGHGAFDLNLSAFIYGTSGVAQETQSQISTPVSRERKLVQVQMFPRNREYFLTSTPSTDEQYHCVAFYSDDTVEDVTNQATWTAVDSSTGQPVAGASFSTQANGHLILNNTAPQFVRLSVSYVPSQVGTISTTSGKDETRIKVVTQ